MERRKFIIGAGALATGSAAAMGTGAVTSSTINDRKATISVTDDSNGQVGLLANEDTDLVYENEEGELTIDLSQGIGSGVNTNSEFAIGGDNTFPAAFTVVNQSPDDVVINVEFELDHPADAGDSSIQVVAVMDYSDANKGPNGPTVNSDNPSITHSSADSSLSNGPEGLVEPSEFMRISLIVNAVDDGDDLSGSFSITTE
jgi:hypothetical protein